MYAPSRRFLVGLLALLAASLQGCSESPPSDQAKKAVEDVVRRANALVYDGDPETDEIVGIKIGAWKEGTWVKNAPKDYHSDWIAKLRFKEPLACVGLQIDGIKVVRVVMEKGEELQVSGSVSAMKFENKWETSASATGGMGLMDAGSIWEPTVKKAAAAGWDPYLGHSGWDGMIYGVYTQGTRSQEFRGRPLLKPLSKLKPYVIEGSPECATLMAGLQEQMRKATEAIAEQQRAAQAAAAERQRQAELAYAQQRAKAQEQQARLQAENAEKQRLAQEEAKRKAEEARHAKLLSILKPFQSPTGSVIITDVAAGQMMGAIVLQADVDEANLTAKGRGIDLREMPFREFSFDASVDARTGALTVKSSIVNDPMIFADYGTAISARGGFPLVAISQPDRAKIDSIVTLGTRLGAAPPRDMQIETIDAATVKAREPSLQLAPLVGTVFFRGRIAPQVAPLFDLAGKTRYEWDKNEVVSVRLNDPAKGSAIYIRAANAGGASNLTVTINGVHRVTIPSIAAGGGAFVKLTPDLDLLDLSFQAVNSAGIGVIGLVR